MPGPDIGAGGILAAAAALMTGAAVCEVFLSVDAEGKALEDIAEPLSGTA